MVSRAEITSAIRTEFQPQQLVSSLTIGIVVGLVEIVFAVPFAELLLSGDLSGYIGYGLFLALFGVLISNVVVSIFSSLPGTVGGNQNLPIVITAVITSGAITVMFTGGATESEVLATILFMIAAITLLTGLFFFFLGYFKLGNLVRFLPYPVIGGVLAGSGWLLVRSAIELLTDLSLGMDALAEFTEPAMLIRWLPGLVFALVMVFASKVTDHLLGMPAIIFSAILIFYLWVWISGSPLAELRTQGLLYEPFSSGSLWRPLPWAHLDQVNWRVIFSNLPAILSLIMLSTVETLLNASGLEVAVEEDVSFNQELRAAGLGNLLGGLAGGLTGYQVLSLSILGVKTGKGGRLIGLVASGLYLIVLFQGATFLSYMPRFVTGGLIMYLGLLFLKEWVYDAWFRLPRIEYAILLLILVVIATVGFLEGVAVGVVAAIILFVVAYSRVDLLHNELTGQHISSRVSRTPKMNRFLQRRRRQISIMNLQGFIFFGTAEKLLNRVRERLDSDEGAETRFLVLDFQRVNGLDSTAVRSLLRLRELMRQRDGRLLVTSADEAVTDLLQNAGLTGDGTVLFLDNLDRGIAWCEDKMLGQAGRDSLEAPNTLVEQLAESLPGKVNFEPLLPYLDRTEYPAGEYLMKQGEPPGSLYFIESGQVSALLESPGQPAIRLQTMGPGHIVGEIGFYLNQARTASVKTDQPSVVYRLSQESLRKMEGEAPETASVLHRLIVHLVSERVSHLTATIEALEK